MTSFPTSTHKYTLHKSSKHKHNEAIMCPISHWMCFFLSFIVFSFLFLTILHDIDTTVKYPLFRVDSAGSLNKLTVYGTKFTAEFNISVSVNNPTSISRVYYDAVSAEIFYRGEGLVLNKTSLPSFTTNRKRSSVIQMTPLVKKSNDFGGVATGIAQSRKDGTVEFGLVLSALFKFKNVVQSSWESLKVVCYPLKFAVSPSDYSTTPPGILLEGLTCIRTRT